MTILDDTSGSSSAENVQQSGISGLRDRLLRIRDRCLTSPRFIQWAERFPLTRPVARRKASALFDLCSGFVYSQVLFACVKLKLFEALQRQPSTVVALAKQINLSEDATKRLLTAAVALDLAEHRSGGRYGLGQLGAAVIASPGLVTMVEHHALLYRDLADPVALLTGEADAQLAGFWPYANPKMNSQHAVSSYTQLMAATQPALASEILDAHDFRRHHHIMDVGGGNGTFLMHAAQRAPNAHLVLFDLPDVTEIARAKFEASNLGDRLTIAQGSFLHGALPEGADLITLIRVILDHDDENALKILRAVRQALPEDGTLLLAEAMAGTGAAPRVAAYFSFYLMAMGKGRPRTEEQLRILLQQAGFSRIHARPTRQPLLTRILLARP